CYDFVHGQFGCECSVRSGILPSLTFLLPPISVNYSSQLAKVLFLAEGFFSSSQKKPKSLPPQKF
ncbi:hypothetical protein, partial [Methylobacter psychrophilus]|uniref:hypothetical protein n=1 Tax=Methylobacter psychrophilus TaxID=96941 RepID=UPI0021D4A2F8